jgi:thioesterase domain-containing protein
LLERGIAAGVLSPETDEARLRRLLKVYTSNQRAWGRYIPRKYDGDVILYRAGDRVAESILNPAIGWGELVAGELEVRRMEGGHYTLLTEPNVRAVAEEMQRSLPRVTPAD